MIINYEEKNLLIRYVSVKPCEISNELIYMQVFDEEFGFYNQGLQFFFDSGSTNDHVTNINKA